jgi:hypothetical protein
LSHQFPTVEVCEVFTVVIAVAVDVELDAVVVVTVVEEVGIGVVLALGVGVDVVQEASNMAAKIIKLKLNQTTLLCIVSLHLD